MDNNSEDSRNYEVAFLIREEELAEKVFSRIGQYGEVTTKGSTKKLFFSYPIEKVSSGFFGYARLRALPDSILALLKDFKTTGEILRLLVTKVPEDKTLREARSGSRQPSKPIKPKAPKSDVPMPQGELQLTNEALEKKIEEILQ